MAGSWFLAAVGRQLTRYRVDVAQGTLAAEQTIELPEGLQYGWQNPVAADIFHLVCSDGRPGSDGSRHVACTLKQDAQGRLRFHGAVLELPWRPVHVTTDPAGGFVFVTYPKPSLVEVFRIRPDGTLGSKVSQPGLPPLPQTAHQLRITPDGRRAVLPLRGNDAAGERPEDPGAVMIFGLRDGVLAHQQTLAPDGGYGFGPRHVDFHPGQPWMYASIERQNQLALFDVAAAFSGPRCRVTTLAFPDAEKPRQLAGAVHVHPNGRTVYVSNRADGTVMADGRPVFNEGENTIAVYAVEPRTGVPTLAQIVDTRGMHVRTFRIDPSGRLLVAANMTPRTRLRDGGHVEVPAGLSVFRRHEDGTLTFLRKYDVDARRDHLFWAGFSRA